MHYGEIKLYINPGATVFRKFWVRSTQWENNWDSDHSRTVGMLWNNLVNLVTADFHQIWSRHVNLCYLETYWKRFSKIFRLLLICHQKPKMLSNRHFTHIPAYNPAEVLQKDTVYCTL